MADTSIQNLSIIPADNDALMPKDKNFSLSRYMKSPSSLRNSILLVLGLVFCGMTVLYFGNSTSSLHMSVDRSDAYSVKVIPDNLDDAALDALPKASFSYLAMIDAGSSGCRAHVYRYGKLGNIEGKLYILPQHNSKKVKPGLSSFANDPTAAGPSIKGLVDFIKEQVPEADWAVTPIWLKATAGLRMLEQEQSSAILISIRNYLADLNNSPFLFRASWARIISGNEEGGFGWIAYNYLMKIIGPKKDVTGQLPYAVIEMGGASSQVSQLASSSQAKSIPDDYKFEFTIEGEQFTLYTHSYLGYGAEQAREALNKALTTSAKGTSVKDPCLYHGYSRAAGAVRKEAYEGPEDPSLTIVGASNSKGTCMHSLSKLFNHQEKCSTTSQGPFSFGCTYQPDFVAKSKNILVFENFYYMSSGIGVHPVGTASKAFPLLTTATEIEEAANEVCGNKLDEMKASYPKDSQPKDTNIKWCFTSSYAKSFLVDGLGIDKDKLLTVQKDVGPSEIEWALGAAYKEAADFLKRTNLRPT